jgi:hypothetical protein
MKKNSLLMIVVTLLLSSCGITSQYTSTSSEARFQDGIYNSTPSFRSKTDKTESRAMTDALIEKTKASEIYLFGEKKDTIMIPENMSASIRYDKSLSSTIVTVGENPYAWQNNLDLWSYYTPYSIGSSWYWSRHYDPWFNHHWYWNRWSYSPWSYYGYGGWYDPWYYGGFYDPWYYGGWYGYMNPYYCGWYGAWDPYWGHHHHHHYHPAGPIDGKDHWFGNRRYTGSDRVFASRVSTRGGVGSSRTTPTRVATTSSSRTSTASRAAVSPARTATSKRTAATTARNAATPTTKVANHRRPAGTTTRHSSSETVSRSTTGRTSSGASYRSSTSSSYSPGSSSSSYRSSSTSPSRSTSYSTGGATRSHSSGGGASRTSGPSRR